MFEGWPLLFRSELVIQRNENAAREKNGASRNQPLRLIGHDYASAIAGGEAGVLQSFGQRMRAFLEVAISQALFLAVPRGFDQAHFFRKLIQRVPDHLSKGLIFRKVQHYRRD